MENSFLHFSCARRLQWSVVLIVLLVSSTLLTSSVGAQERTYPIKIGVLTASWGPTPETVGLRDGLLELGYRENEQFVLGVRFTQGDLTALPAAARELVQYGVDIIFTSDDSPAKAAQMATTRIPIVFSVVSDPVGLGLIQSFARPGGNITGVTDLRLELGPKRLELFHEIVPGLKRVLYLYDAADADAVAGAKMYREAAHRLGIELIEKPVRTEEEAQATLAQVRKGEVDGILQPPSASLNIPGFILEASSQQAIPTMFERSVLDGARWTRQLWSGLSRNRQASGTPDGQDSQRGEPSRDSRGGEPEGRVCYQSESCESPRAHDRAGSVVSG